MRHVLLDTKNPGTILGHFANPQPHLGTHPVPDDDPLIVAWVAERKRLKEEGLERSRQQRELPGYVDALERRIAALEREVARLKAQ